MGSLFAYFNKSGEYSHYDVVKDALDEMSYWKPDKTGIWVNDVLGLGCHMLNTSQVSIEDVLPYWQELSGCCIVADARIDYKDELARDLGIDSEDAKRLTDSQLILRSYLKWKDTCTDHLYGDFSFIVWNDRIGELFCARDHFGTRPLYYVNHENFFAISSDLKGFRSIPHFDLQLKELSLLEIMCSIIPNKDVSSFEGVSRLEPATNLRFSAQGTATLTRYWDLKPLKEFSDLTEEEAMQGLRNRFIDAVAQRSISVGIVGVELSGGLDSSSVASVLCRTLEGNSEIIAFSHVQAEKNLFQSSNYKDELNFSRQVAASTGITRHYYISGDSMAGSFAALQNSLDDRLVPEIQFFATLSDLLLEEAKKAGVNILLSGYGGDEGVTNSGEGIFREYIERRDYVKLKQALREKVRRNGGNYYKKLIKQHLLVYAPWVLKLLQQDWRKSRYKSFMVNRALMIKQSMKKRYYRYSAFQVALDVRTIQYNRLMHPHLPDRLETSFYAALARRVEYRYPFLDVKLLEFYYSLKSEYKYKNGIGRYVFREAMKGKVHEDIRLRKDKTFITIPNFYTRLLKDEAEFRNIIYEAEKNSTYHYADYNKLRCVLDDLKDKKRSKSAEVRATGFLGTVSVLILQKWQREGKIDIGIKC